MLVVISDLHLTDGTTGSTIGASAFHDFTKNLRELAYDASWRDNRAAQAQNPNAPDKRYEPIDSFDIILMGDIFDIIRSTRWTDDDCQIRPWPTKEVPNWEEAFSEKVEEITNAILANNQEALSRLRAITPKGDSLIEIPHAQNGYPDHQPPLKQIQARIFYIAGNHDWVYVCEGERYNRIRTQLCEQIGLANDPTKPFPYDLASESHPTLHKLMREHSVFLRHGDFYDEFNFDEKAGRRDVASLGDALVIELINRFPIAVQEAIGDQPNFDQTFIDDLKEIANVRPLTSLPAWLNSLLERFKAHGMHKSMRREVQGVWNQLVDNLLKSEFVRAQDKFGLQPVDKLQLLLQASRFVTLPFSERIIEIGESASRVVSSALDHYARAAAAEPWLVSGNVRYVAYGHTHNQRVVPLDRRITDERDEELLYFNAGTWKNIHEQTLFSGEGASFASYIVMSYVTFFKDDERSGRPFEVWSGTLANRQIVSEGSKKPVT